MATRRRERGREVLLVEEVEGGKGREGGSGQERGWEENDLGVGVRRFRGLLEVCWRLW